MPNPAATCLRKKTRTNRALLPLDVHHYLNNKLHRAYLNVVVSRYGLKWCSLASELRIAIAFDALLIGWALR